MNKYTVIYPNGESLVIAASKHECFANNGVLTHCFATEDIIDTIIYGHIRISATPIPPTKDEQLKASVKEIARLEKLIEEQKKVIEQKDESYSALSSKIRDREYNLEAHSLNLNKCLDSMFTPKEELRRLVKEIRAERVDTSISVKFAGQFVCADDITSARSVVVPWRAASYGQLGDKL